MMNKTMMNKRNHWLGRVVSAVLVSFIAVSVAVAGPLTQPKADGWIGEQANGYIGLVKAGAPANIKALVADANANRKAGYQKIAQKQGIPLADVEKVGGNTAIEKTLSGNYIKSAGGSWQKKP
jgi:uncharacterized protein YdbL (DUF1318 family)